MNTENDMKKIKSTHGKAEWIDTDDDIIDNSSHPSQDGTTVADCLRIGTEAYLQYARNPCYPAQKSAKQWAAVLKAILALGPSAVR
jgi:hypothetical protein